MSTIGFMERCRLQRVCRSFLIDKQTCIHFPKNVISLKPSPLGFMNALAMYKPSFRNIVMLHMFDSIISDPDQLALSAVEWTNLTDVKLIGIGLFDRPLALFLKKWRNTLSIARDSVCLVLDLPQHGCTLSWYQIVSWCTDLRLKFLHPRDTSYRWPEETYMLKEALSLRDRFASDLLIPFSSLTEASLAFDIYNSLYLVMCDHSVNSAGFAHYASYFDLETQRKIYDTRDPTISFHQIPRIGDSHPEPFSFIDPMLSEKYQNGLKIKFRQGKLKKRQAVRARK